MVVLTETLPCASSSSSLTKDRNHKFVYDVFLSFRGVDTRNGFTDHLYNSLLDAGINTFLDDEEIETGEPLKPELEGAIRSSRASIIVLSQNYATSTWCLDELVLILEQKRIFNQIVIPVFYDVEPTDVRKQESSFGVALEKHKQTMETEANAEKRSELTQKMESWKTALTEVAKLKGKDAKGRKETELIKEVVIDIHRKLGVLLSNSLPRLVGRDLYIQLISSWLTDESCHTADFLTVIGIGGIGKTSLAKYIFQKHSSKFHKSSFIEGIDTRCNERFNGLLDLQKQLHGDISKKFPLQVNDQSVYTTKIENALARKMVFIVLDDIGSLKQLDALLGSKGLHPGSKVIITTKDASLTERCALFNPQVQPKLKKVSLSGLSMTKSLELLCIHAFPSQTAKEGYREVSEKIVNYCGGHPLALEILSRSLKEQNVAYWEDCIEGLKKEPHSCIKTVLNMSIGSLPSENNKDLFKHIACFFVGMDRDVAEAILYACNINTRSGIAILIDRCLLSIRPNNKLVMHQLVQQMGRDLVREEAPDKPWKRSRLWCHEESFKVLKQKKGKGSLLGLALDMRMLDKKKSFGSFELKTESFSHMDNLMLLQLNYLQLNGCFGDFPEELRWLCMHGFPSKSINLDLPMENLVCLDMSDSNIESFDMSKDKRLLGSLKILDLSFCEQLLSVGGFFFLLTLERLIVRNCISLVKVCESVEKCVELVHIDLSYCYKLKKFPISIGKLKKVKALLLDGCNYFESQIEACDVKSSDCSILEPIPSNCRFLAISLPHSLRTLSLANNNLCNESFPIDWSCLSMLEELYLDKNPIASMPNCVRTLPRLQRLFMDECEMLISVKNPPRSLKSFSVDFSTNRNSIHERKPLPIIRFDLEMSPLRLQGVEGFLSNSLTEIDGMVKIQGAVDVDEKLLHSLGWIDLEFLRTTHANLHLMYYKFGIFSTFYWGSEIPNWISHISKGSSISFTIPSSPKKLRGFNFCCSVKTNSDDSLVYPTIKINNITKDHTWNYEHYICEDRECGNWSVSLLSHWMFGPNEMKAGDHINVTVEQKYLLSDDEVVWKECGIGLVYEEDGKSKEEGEDGLGYYKAWNYIIGGHHSAFKLRTGKYI